MNDKLRLVRRSLDLVQRAVSEGLIPLSTACLAPGQITACEQEAWLARAYGVRALRGAWARSARGV